MRRLKLAGLLGGASESVKAGGAGRLGALPPDVFGREGMLLVLEDGVLGGGGGGSGRFT